MQAFVRRGAAARLERYHARKTFALLETGEDIIRRLKAKKSKRRGGKKKREKSKEIDREKAKNSRYLSKYIFVHRNIALPQFFFFASNVGFEINHLYFHSNSQNYTHNIQNDNVRIANFCYT